MTSSFESHQPARIARCGDLETVTEIITLAFAEDPVWGPAFPADRGSTDRRDIWRCYLAAVLRFPWTWLSAGDTAISVWIPPGEQDLTAEHEAAFVAILRERLGVAADAVEALFGRFDAAHPGSEPHYYLSLLGTHPDHRGAGHGMRLLTDNLALIDAEGMPAYLESTNPANNARYGRLGFEPIGSFEGYVPGSVVTTMWRSARR
jgi:GNAT superfamily N-acetyltransferase